MNQMSRTIKALSTLDIYKSCKLEFQNLWSRYLEALCVPVIRAPGCSEE